ncbi:hypothetical protein MSG28_005427 [Choristoneura fumiferana]|uniref:Uncharacterized protein n=1 Tax=Choristoneura fumiferana TaxID=7141 RepID=A0ACC0JRA5_CHOFU|nr:hypothetical protein MSG28_005427 [Choristoneura fumiferana]
MRRFDVVLDCAGLGGAGAGAARLSASFGVYVTLTSPLLRRADALGLAPGAAAAAADLLRENLSAAAPPPRRPRLPAARALGLLRAARGRHRAAAPARRTGQAQGRSHESVPVLMVLLQDYMDHMHTHVAAHAAGGGGGGRRCQEHSLSTVLIIQQFGVSVERAWGWREGAAAYERAARGHARGKLLLDFSQP